MYKLYREIDGVPLNTLSFENSTDASKAYHKYCNWLKTQKDVKELIYSDVNFRGFTMDHNVNVILRRVT